MPNQQGCLGKLLLREATRDKKHFPKRRKDLRYINLFLVLFESISIIICYLFSGDKIFLEEYYIFQKLDISVKSWKPPKYGIFLFVLAAGSLVPAACGNTVSVTVAVPNLPAARPSLLCQLGSKERQLPLVQNTPIKTREGSQVGNRPSLC